MFFSDQMSYLQPISNHLIRKDSSLSGDMHWSRLHHFTQLLFLLYVQPKLTNET